MKKQYSFALIRRDWTMDKTAAGLSKDFLPICEDNGDYYYLNKSNGISFWSHDGSTDESWPDLATWIMEVWTEEG